MIPPDWKCPRRVGFLFPHPCERTTPVGCPDCQNAQLADPYGQRVDRYGYTDYDAYDDSTISGYALAAGVAGGQWHPRRRGAAGARRQPGGRPQHRGLPGP